ncbi:DNA-deoxyinosine glycosylase [Candidatus Stoquefichus massiliensis]|uniref:DNA-deoxyinosine glycosylase n=1 Tax=Candidatus Stoquefichus massiliensis TaxID=1470350 RepID=UPI000482A11C|nr:DNA-deoxyinosine glycosylase [Candidatus Stoquefichus massiliensis]
MKQYHNIPPIYNIESQILILGSFPSVKSREGQFFYHHPQNRFWKVLETLYQYPPLNTIDEKKKFLLENHIAVWDVIKSCDIHGSNDNSIENVIVNDISHLLENTQIHTIYTNGKKAHTLYQKYCYSFTHIDDICLPSTSPANANYSLEKLLQEWKIIL